MKLRATLSLLCLLLVTALISGCSLLTRQPPAVTSLTLTDKVNETTKVALTPLTRFPAGTMLMYASAQVEHPVEGTKVEGRWYYDKEKTGAYGLVDSTEVTLPDKEGRHVAFSLEATTTFPAGSYKVEVYLNGKLARELAFTVE